MQKRIIGKAMPKIADDKKFLSINEASVYTSLSKPFLYKLTSKNEIPFYKVGSRVLFLIEELDSFILDNRVTSTTELEERVIEYTITKEMGGQKND